MTVGNNQVTIATTSCKMKVEKVGIVPTTTSPSSQVADNNIIYSLLMEVCVRVWLDDLLLIASKKDNVVCVY